MRYSCLVLTKTLGNRAFKILISENREFVGHSCKNGLEGEKKSADIKPKNSLFLNDNRVIQF